MPAARLLPALVAALLVHGAAAQPQPIPARQLGLPGEASGGELHLPAGAGPHPAVVLLHGCSGVTPTVRGWARRLAEWGHAALVLDSFGPRGIANVCGTAGTGWPGTRSEAAARVTPRIRAEDAFAAAAWLRGRGDIVADRVALVGFSHGGTTALAAASQAVVARLRAQPFVAVVAFYPYCPLEPVPLASPLLTLIGDADDWTPAERCQRRQAAWPEGFGTAALQVYSGATHAFDAPGPERVYRGFRLRHDAAATAEAAAQLRGWVAGAGRRGTR